jgi:hypothetical protein
LIVELKNINEGKAKSMEDSHSLSSGIIYAGIGVIAILFFLKLKQGGADESRMLAFLDEFTTGRIVIFIILAGTVCYIIWPNIGHIPFIQVAAGTICYGIFMFAQANR